MVDSSIWATGGPLGAHTKPRSISVVKRSWAIWSGKSKRSCLNWRNCKTLKWRDMDTEFSSANGTCCHFFLWLSCQVKVLVKVVGRGRHVPVHYSFFMRKHPSVWTRAVTSFSVLYCRYCQTESYCIYVYLCRTAIHSWAPSQLLDDAFISPASFGMQESCKHVQPPAACNGFMRFTRSSCWTSARRTSSCEATSIQLGPWQAVESRVQMLVFHASIVAVLIRANPVSVYSI